MVYGSIEGERVVESVVSARKIGHVGIASDARLTFYARIWAKYAKTMWMML